jgi:outer membrane receptor protein involved in Fe transport
VYYNGDYIVGYGPSTNENPNLKWEEKREFNLGFDVAVAKNKLNVSIDYFKNKSSDLIDRYTVPSPPNVANSTFLNAMELSGSGYEVSLEYNNILNSEKLDWSANLVYNHYSVQVEKTGYDEPVGIGYPGAPGMCCAQYILIQEGQPLGQIWGPVRVGVNADGSIQYKDINRDGVVGFGSIDVYNQDQTLIGSALPKFELGFQKQPALASVRSEYFPARRFWA